MPNELFRAQIVENGAQVGGGKPFFIVGEQKPQMDCSSLVARSSAKQHAEARRGDLEQNASRPGWSFFIFISRSGPNLEFKLSLFCILIERNIIKSIRLVSLVGMRSMFCSLGSARLGSAC